MTEKRRSLHAWRGQAPPENGSTIQAREAPCAREPRQGVFPIGGRPHTIAQNPLPYASESALEEAVRNFRAYLDILREWEEREMSEAQTAELERISARDH